MAGTILFVDDEIEMGFIISNLFKQYGFDVINAENADVAMNMADAGPLSAMILDIDIAGESGLKLMAFLHRNHPGVPIILYTGAEHEQAVIDKALKEGARFFLRKGRPMSELVDAVRSVTGQAG